MKTLIVGTTNQAKVDQIRDALSSLTILVSGIADMSGLPVVNEDGLTVQENARKKATAYAKALNQNVLSMDNALFLNGLTQEMQPGLHVRRIGGIQAATDAELLQHGISLVKTLGANPTGYWEYGICIASPCGLCWETTLRTDRVFTSTPSKQMIPGYPLESIQIDPETGVYISEMLPHVKAMFWKRMLGEPLANLIKTIP